MVLRLARFFGLNSWIAVLLKSHGFSIIGSVGFVTLITLGGIPGFYLTGVLLERIGRKPVTAAVLVFGAAAAFVYGSATTITILFVTGFVMQFFMFGMWRALRVHAGIVFDARAGHRCRPRLCFRAGGRDHRSDRFTGRRRERGHRRGVRFGRGGVLHRRRLGANPRCRDEGSRFGAGFGVSARVCPPPDGRKDLNGRRLRARP